MKMLKVIEKRESIREYKDKHLSHDHKDKLTKLFTELPQELSEAEIEVRLLENGHEVYDKLDGIAGYYGNMIKAPNYMLILSDKKEDYLEAGGYVGEWLVLQCTKMDLGTCWVEVCDKADQVKEALDLDTDKQPLALIALGYPEGHFAGASIFNHKANVNTITDIGYPQVESKEPALHHSSRLSITDIVYLEEWGTKIPVEELEQRGYSEVFYYMRLAPSWGNRQPWRFILDGSKITLAIIQDNRVDYSVEKIEAGIAMLYFEVAMHGEGLPGKWQVCTDKYAGTVKVPEGVFVAGEYSFVY